MSRPNWTHIVIHHSAGHDSSGLELAEIRRFHKQGRGWTDIGYHVVVEEIDGVPVAIFARPWWRPGSHCPEQGMNRRALGVCLVGNFSKAPPSGPLLEAAADCVGSLCSALGIAVKDVQPHRNLKATQCPGDLFPWELFVSMVAQRIGVSRV